MGHGTCYRFSRTAPQEQGERRIQAGLSAFDQGGGISAGDPGTSDNLKDVRMKIPFVRNIRLVVVALTLVPVLSAPVSFAQSPPFDIWTPEVMQRIRDQGTRGMTSLFNLRRL